jgi:hypothetical protein
MWCVLFFILLILLHVDMEQRFVCDAPFSEHEALDVAECRRALRLVQTAEDGGRPGPPWSEEYHKGTAGDRHGANSPRTFCAVQDELDEEPESLVRPLTRSIRVY